MKHGVHILLVDDDEIDREAIQRFIIHNQLPYSLTSATSGKEALDILKDKSFDIILLDYHLGDSTAFDWLPTFQAKEIPVVIITGNGSESIAVEAMKRGASDYLIKDPSRQYLPLLSLTIKSVLEKQKNKNEFNKLRCLLIDIINTVPAMLIGVDKQCRVSYWNREAERLSGLDAGSVLGIPLEKAYPPLAGQESNIQFSIETGKIQKLELVFKNSDDKSTLLNVSIYPLINCLSEGAVLRIEDITEKMRIETMILHSEKMLSVSSLAVGMAHELNNPLAGIMQSVQVMKNRLKEELPKNKTVARQLGIDLTDISRYIETRGIFTLMENITQSGRQAAHIVNNLLNFSHSSNSQSASHQVELLLDEALAIATKDHDLCETYHFHQIPVIKEYDEYLPAVICEPVKLKQVFFNILKNGAQAMKDNPLTRPPQFKLKVSPENRMVRVEIQDNGHGMDSHLQRRIFEPFFTARKVGEGAGLGLSVSYFIITREHNGTIEVQSSPDEGSCFILKLPLDRRNH